jgi:DNA modification methylase
VLNKLFYGDNLDVLREKVASESVDLVYLDPPFNSNRSYNVIFGRNETTADVAAAQIQAFNDTWHWTPITDGQYQRYTQMGELPERVADALTAFWTLLGENDAMAYLVNMAPRLVELHRVLKSTGSLYLHCDPTMSHYLKILLDAIFGPNRFVNEITWKRSTAHSDSKQGARHMGRVHDTILFYTKTDGYPFTVEMTQYDEKYVAKRFVHQDSDGRRYKDADLTAAKPGGDTSFGWRVKALVGTKNWEGDIAAEWQNPKPGWTYKEVFPSSGRYWAYSRQNFQAFHEEDLLYYTSTGTPRLKQYADELEGVQLQDIWNDIFPVNSQAAERLGYPTQKPVALLERIVRMSSKEGDVVLDPFCGCGTTIDAAQKLNRTWMGIDITFIAVDLIQKRLQDRYPGIEGTYETFGIPRDIEGAMALFKRSPFDFERWAVSRVDARPNEKQVGDKGVDGVARFYLDKKTFGRVLVSVKGGANIGPQFVRDLIGTVQTQKAQMGVLITMAAPTRGVLDAVDHGGTYTWPVNGQSFPLVQVITVADLLAGNRPRMPQLMLPYIQASRALPQSDQMDLFGQVAFG